MERSRGEEREFMSSSSGNLGPAGDLRVDDLPISRVREGMDVVDSAGDKVGEVDLVRLGDPESVTLAGQEAPGRDAGIVDDVVRAFGGDDEPRVPDALRARMIHDGYIRIDGGLLGATRYAIAGQVASVSGDTVRLDARKDELPEQ